MFKTNNNGKYFIFDKSELLPPALEYDDFKNFLRSSDSKKATGTTSLPIRYKRSVWARDPHIAFTNWDTDTIFT